MTKDDILQLIRQGESFRLEAKRAEKEVPASVWESYSAWRVGVTLLPTLLPAAN